MQQRLNRPSCRQCFWQQRAPHVSPRNFAQSRDISHHLLQADISASRTRESELLRQVSELLFPFDCYLAECSLSSTFLPMTAREILLPKQFNTKARCLCSRAAWHTAKLTLDQQQLVVFLSRLILLSPSQKCIPSGFFPATSAAARDALPPSWLSCSPDYFHAAMPSVRDCVDELTEVLMYAIHPTPTSPHASCKILSRDKRPGTPVEALDSHQPSHSDDRYQQLQLMLAHSEAPKPRSATLRSISISGGIALANAIAHHFSP
jgi:hypothetical protein